MARTFLYVDGESHYSMTERCCKNILGSDITLEEVKARGGEPGRLRHRADARFFWDSGMPSRNMRSELAFLERRVYFTSFVGTEQGLHDAKVFIRNSGFDPEVVREQKDLAKQRQNQLRAEGLIIKCKGVDIGLSVRILEDAYANLFDECYVATSDYRLSSRFPSDSSSGQESLRVRLRARPGKGLALSSCR
jgi:hypothetical protein